ncbi:MAG: molecular chaperone HtpG [Deltaproteobacteria bacterium]|nr:MAG: molecular chaperone HtpG [Deltaproteobacteria bacterium]
MQPGDETTPGLGINRAQVDFEGLMRVLGNNLYSTPVVALRELVQNAHDSCTRRELEEGSFDPRIDVTADPTRKRLIIDDNGAGLTQDEVHKYLATVGAGYTRLLRESQGADDLIGAFGLGFLSAYVVSDRVEVLTTSYQNPEQTWRFSSRNGQQYTLEASTSRKVGTRVILHLRERFHELANQNTVSFLLERYCCLLPLPIHAPHQVNAVMPPWRQDLDELSPIRRRKLELSFASRFESKFEPITTIPVEMSEDTDAQGVLWIQDGATYGTSDNRRVVLFVRGMLISDDARDLLPRWAGFVGGVIECDSLNPTASREEVQKDEFFHAAAFHVQEALIEGLFGIARSEPEAWRRILMRHNEALLGATLTDERLFDLLHDELTVPTSEGDLPLSTVVERSDGSVYVSVSEKGGYEEVLFRALSKPIVNGVRYAARPFAQQYCEMHGHTLVELGTKLGDENVFPHTTVDSDVVDAFSEVLADNDTEIKFSHFAPESLPIVLVTNNEIALKRRIEDDEADKRISSGVLGLARMFTKKINEGALSRMYINLDCPVVQRLTEAEGVTRTQGLTMLKVLAQLMSQKGQEDTHRDLGQTLEMFCDTLLHLLPEAPLDA